MRTRMNVGLAALAACLMLPMAAPAALVNGGFETGDLTGWTMGSGVTANVVTSNTTTYSPGIWGDPVTTNPAEGTYMLAIQSGSANIWQEVYQALDLSAGDTIGGQAFFDWGDYWTSGVSYIDGAKVEILNSLGAVVATPWETDGSDYCLTFCPPATGQAGAESGWIGWSFTATSTDTYTVVYAARNTSDGGGPNATFGYFDAIGGPQQVPAPATLALIGLGLAGIGYQRRKQIKTS